MKPVKVRFVAVLAALIGVAALSAAAWLASISWTEPPQVATGRVLYTEYCAACHGADLQGQPDWQNPLPSGRMPAPPHNATGHTWHHSDRQLFMIVKHGMDAVVPGYESDMPAFGDVLTDQEIRSTIAFIKSTWPERERDFQAARSRADP